MNGEGNVLENELDAIITLTPTTMPNHDVKFSVPMSTLGKADIELVIRKDGKKLRPIRG